MTGLGRVAPLFEQFDALSAVPGLRHGFTLRIPGLDVRADRSVALARLAEDHARVREMLGLRAVPLVLGEQVHGAAVAVVDADSRSPVAGVDGVITAGSDVCLGVYVADCCAIYLVDPVTRTIGLAHSGKRGTDGNIAGVTVRKMVETFACQPAHLIAQLSPCIRPPHYEVDFATMIVAQLRAAGVQQVHDTARCTACEPERYYSYRAELGRTGRMLAILGFIEAAK
jgi:copper oxidase (laccase) domain-containing protein